jgi:hypothetical protein
MSKKNAMGKLYDRLSPSERFRLDVEAQARGDETESRRLVDSCPRRNYSMTDWAFSGRWQTTTEIVLAVCVDLSQYMSRLNMIDAIQETLPYAHVVYYNETDDAYLSGHEAGSRYAWERAGMDGDPPGWAPLDEDGEESMDAEDFEPAIDAELEATGARLEEADIMPELLTRLEEKTTQQAWTLFEAFSSLKSPASVELLKDKLLYRGVVECQGILLEHPCRPANCIFHRQPSSRRAGCVYQVVNVLVPVAEVYVDRIDVYLVETQLLPCLVQDLAPVEFDQVLLAARGVEQFAPLRGAEVLVV